MADATPTPNPTSDIDNLLAGAPDAPASEPSPEAAAKAAFAELTTAGSAAPSVEPESVEPETSASLDDQLREAARAVTLAEAALVDAKQRYIELSSQVAAMQQRPLSLHELNQLTARAGEAERVAKAEALEALRKLSANPAALGLLGARLPKRAPHPPLFPTSAPAA